VDEVFTSAEQTMKNRAILDAACLYRDESEIDDKTIADAGNKNHREAGGNKKLPFAAE